MREGKERGKVTVTTSTTIIKRSAHWDKEAVHAVVHSTDPGARLPKLDPGSITCTPFLCLGFLTCKMRIIVVPI